MTTPNPITGPIIPKNNSTENALPYVSPLPADYNTSPISAGEIATNIKDGRLWLRKVVDTTGLNTVYRYNYEQIGGPYVIMEKTGGHTFAPEDTGRILFMNNGTTANIKIPSYTGASGIDFVIGTQIMLIQGTTQPIYISGATGVTIDVKNNSYTFDIQNGFIQCLKVAQDRWLITGDRDTAGLASQTSLLDIANDVNTIETLLNNFGVGGYGGATWQ